MGHAGAIITGGQGGPEDKVRAFERVGVPVMNTIPDVADKVAELVGAASGA
jgi:succinyl-CoA synthetase alpha subunit